MFQELFISNLSRDWRQVQELLISNVSRDWRHVPGIVYFQFIWTLETCSRNCLFKIYLETGGMFPELFISNLSRDWRHVSVTVYFQFRLSRDLRHVL